MGLFSKKEQTNPIEVYGKEIEKFLMDGEIIEDIYPLVVDFLCITNKRLIFVDKKFKELTTVVISIPYSKLVDVAIAKKENSFILTNELILSTYAKDYNLKFLNIVNAVEIYNKIIKKIL